MKQAVLFLILSSCYIPKDLPTPPKSFLRAPVVQESTRRLNLTLSGLTVPTGTHMVVTTLGYGDLPCTTQFGTCKVSMDLRGGENAVVFCLRAASEAPCTPDTWYGWSQLTVTPSTRGRIAGRQ